MLIVPCAALLVGATAFVAFTLNLRCRRCRRWWAYRQGEWDASLERSCLHCGHTLRVEWADPMRKETS